MSQPSRLTELTGITTAADESESFWPLNVVLVLLGAAVLAISFYFLDQRDERFFYNPWTYAIATPVSLLVFSALLSTVVSRVIEKSMQMAFLLSVLVHLLLLVYAVNIVIFSRMWPEILDSLAEERHQLKREALQAKQYYRVSITTQTGRKPDYLSHVPTQHQPTEVSETDSPALMLARSERPNLVSPVPKVELTANPHILERSQPSPSLPADSEQAASLSRSELRQRLEQQSSPEQFSIEESPANLALTPSASTLMRHRSLAGTDLRPPAIAPVPVHPEVSVSMLEREEAPSASLPRQPPNRISIPRDPNMAAARVVDPAQIDIPSFGPSATSPPPAHASSRSDLSNRVRREEPSVLALDLRQLESADSMNRALAGAKVPIRRDLEWQQPDPSSGDSPTSLARQTAGGRTGPPAANSMPLYGPDLAAGGEVTPRSLTTPRMSISRRAAGERRADMLPGSALAQAPSWNNSPSLAGGVAGVSPSALAEQAAAGIAKSQDIADLKGDSGAIKRSYRGLSAIQGMLTPPASPEKLSSPESLGGAPGLSSQASKAEMVADHSAINRASGSNTGISDLAMPESLRPANMAPKLPTGLARASDRIGTVPDEQSASDAASSQALAKSEGSIGAPMSGDVQVPIDESQPSSSEFGSALAIDSAPIRRSARASSQTVLDIEMPPGQGGISPILETTGLLLPRRSSLVGESTPVDLDAQRFARQQVGGPLAAGQKVAMPAPAFQQRLERIRDRNPLDATSIEPQTELAIERGLAYLAKHQRTDGSWRLQDFDTPVLMRSDTAATGLALLAFQGAGYTHKQFRYAEVVERAIQFLRRHQAASGDLYIPQDPASDQNARLYSHGIAALALSEAFGMTQDPELREVAQRSLDYMVASQDPSRGGWRYQPGRGTDTSVTGWFMMAFKSGQLAGLTVPSETFDRIRAFLDESQVSAQQPHLYRYNPFASDTPQQRHGLQPTAVMTSVGLLMRLYLGWQRERPEMIFGTDYLLQHLPEEGTRLNSRRDTYYWYYATQVLFHMGGDRWKKWHDELYPLLIENQITSGEHEGSWDPLLPTPDLWARYGGRLYVTTMNLLSLEVSYRHLPLYDATGYDGVPRK